MKTKLNRLAQVAVFGIIALGNAAYAFPFSHLVDATQSQVEKFSASERTDCANLSGKFKGSCSKLQSEDLELTIEQAACARVKINSDVTFVGGIESMNKSFPVTPSGVGLGVLAASGWSDDRSTLLYSISTIAKPLNDSKPASIHGNASLALKGENQLVVQIDFAEVTASCILNRQ